jgi:hypothetical protein
LCSSGGSGINLSLHPGADALCFARLDSQLMTTSEYLLNIALVGLVGLQIRGIKLTKAALLLPVVMTAWAASQILQTVPTAGNDLVLELVFAVAGCALGVLAGVATSVRRAGAAAVATAGVLAAALWVFGIGARVGFSLWVQHSGAPAVRQFSLAQHITGGAAWGTGFVLMALAELCSRTCLLYVKARRTGTTIERGGLLRRFVSA